MFAFEHYQIVPDMVVIGKGLGGGIFPLAALIAREGLNIAMADRALGHYTHEKNPVGCAAALAVIQVIEQEKLLENANRVGASALQRMREMSRRYGIIGDVRGLGLLMGIELIPGPEYIEEQPPMRRSRSCTAALKRGLNFKLTMGNIMTLTPPISITDQEMSEALDILDACLSEVDKKLA